MCFSMNSAHSFDQRVRLAAFDWLRKKTSAQGDVLDRKLLARGFPFEGERIPLVSPQGIFKPRQLEIPLTISTAPGGPYSDTFHGGLLSYRYRGKDPEHRDNVGLQRAMSKGVPLIYLYGLIPGRYLVVYPVFVVADDRGTLTFTIAVEDRLLAESGRISEWPSEIVGESGAIRREYITGSVRVRLHQHAFRERVLRAYREQCALCRLRHQELLDAAHIIPDADPGGEPEVRNGLSLCKLHHAAFDRHFLGVRPDYIVVVRQDVLEEIDGPMLRHGLQGLHGTKIYFPRNEMLRPDQERLAARFEEFRRAG